MQNLDEELRAVHAARIDALVQCDLEALDLIVADELEFVSAAGVVMKKPQIVAALKSGAMSVRKIESQDIETRQYENMALLTYRAMTTVQDGPRLIDGWTQNTCVFIHRDGRWQMVHQHQCSVT